MLAAALAVDEPARLEALYAAALLDTGPEFFFEEALESLLYSAPAPVALVSLVDEWRQWFKASRGLDVDETPRACAFCGYAILSDAPLIVTDARRDDRFSDNPLVRGAPHVVAYAGAPIILKRGGRIGTICIIDKAPRAWTHVEIAHLTEIAALVASYIDLRSALLRRHPQRYLDLVMSTADLSWD